MTEKKRRMVKVNFTGKEALEGRVFDTTLADIAKEAGIFDERRTYGPLNIILGEKELMEKVEAELEAMNEGEKKVVKLLAKEAFGERNPQMVRVIPLQNFLEQKINPFPGLVVRVANAIGKVQSVSSGRVRIDFNHPLSGRDVEYHVELVKEIKNKNEVAETIFEKYYSRIPNSKKETNEGKLTITLSPELIKNLGQINEAVKKIAKDFDVEIEFEEDKAVQIEKVKKDENVGHVHGPECNHAHEEEEETREKKKSEEKSEVKEKPKSIHKIADEARGQAKKENNFDVTRDSSTTIQRPKKK